MLTVREGLSFPNWSFQSNNIGRCSSTNNQSAKPLSFETNHANVLAINHVVAGCEKLLQKLESRSTFCGPKQSCFGKSDVTSVYGVTPP